MCIKLSQKVASPKKLQKANPIGHPPTTITPNQGKRSRDFVAPAQPPSPQWISSFSPRPSSTKRLEQSDQQNNTDPNSHLPHHHHNYWLASWIGVILFKIGVLTWYFQLTCPTCSCPCVGTDRRRRHSYQLLSTLTPEPQPSTSSSIQTTFNASSSGSS